MGETSWAAAINDAKNNLTDSDIRVWEKHSIFRVPTYLMPEPNYKAYKPLVVSIGPFHHGEEHLSPTEEHKRTALICLLKETNKVVEDYMNPLRDILQQLMDSYERLDGSWRQDEDRFLKLMVLDGCFMIQIFRTVPVGNFHHNGVFSPAWQSTVIPLIKRDMLLIENQLPLIVLQMLSAVAFSGNQSNINRLLLRFCFPRKKATYMGPGLHMLDVVRCSMLKRPRDSGHLRSSYPSTPVCRGNLQNRYSGKGNWPAAKLEPWVTFEKSSTNNLDDITVDNGVLRLPCITIERQSESIFLNFIAFEQLCFGAYRFLTSFCSLMVSIITSPEDVSFLHKKEIIEILDESEIEVAEMIKKLSMVPFFSGDNNTLDQVRQDFNNLCMQQRPLIFI